MKFRFTENIFDQGGDDTGAHITGAYTHMKQSLNCSTLKYTLDTLLYINKIFFQKKRIPQTSSPHDLLSIVDSNLLSTTPSQSLL